MKEGTNSAPRLVAVGPLTPFFLMRNFMTEDIFNDNGNQGRLHVACKELLTFTFNPQSRGPVAGFREERVINSLSFLRCGARFDYLIRIRSTGVVEGRR